MPKILLVGGSGFIGKKISAHLLDNDFEVNWLTRRSKLTQQNVKQFEYNFEKKQIDLNAFKDIDVLINLAGENLSTKRWSKKFKESIYKSRVDISQFVFDTIQSRNINIPLYIQASAIGFYGMLNKEQGYIEEDQPGNDFLAKVCKDWEIKAKQFEMVAERVIILRFGVIFHREATAYKKLMMPVRFGIAIIPGDGRQYLNYLWMHDLNNFILYSIQHTNVTGIYNLVSNNTHSYNEFFIRYDSNDSKLLFIHLPKWLMRISFGEMANMLLCGPKILNTKVLETGFVFSDKLESMI